MNFAGCAKKETPAGGSGVFSFEKEKAVTTSEAAKTQPANVPMQKGAEKNISTFENSIGGWEIPDWAMEKEDHVARKISLSQDFAKDGASSLKVDVAFPGNMWTGALVELAEYFDLGSYSEISCSIYLPKEAPVGLKAKIILTVGSSWKFTEMSRSITLIPGEWNVVKANMLPGSEDWKATEVDDVFRRDVRKIAIRVESNKSPVYTGSFYIDSVKASN